VEIPGIFGIYNELKMYGDTRIVNFRYGDSPWAIKQDQNAANCIECGTCLEKCPQHIAIPDRLKEVHEELISYL
jgi:predicted aldo/keto reductase-like oxidoreductase